MNISEVTDKELDSLRHIFNDARRAARCFPRKDFTMAEFLSAIEGEDVLAARDLDKITGFVSVWPDENFVHHLYIDPNFQDRGIGTLLIEQCGIQYGSPLRLKCLVNNLKAVSFYRRSGWIEEGRAVGTDGPYINFCLVA